MRRTRIEAHLADGHVAVLESLWAGMRADAEAVLRKDPSNTRARELPARVELAERAGAQGPSQSR